MRSACLILLCCFVPTPPVRAAVQQIECNLLIAGATESGWAAAIQAARLGIDKIVIVHDGKWFGGQFTEQALACVDENKGMDKVGWGVDWHPMRRAFHRFGLFKELMDRIEAFNEKKYGSPMPGKPWHGPSTFRPAEAEAIFREMIQPWIASGHIREIWNRYPVAAEVVNSRLRQVSFAPVQGGSANLHVRARLTIDATDWGEVIQAAGVKYECGPDPRSRYDEPSAPRAGTFPPNEMNPITWAMIVEESDGETPIAQPSRFDDRNYPRATGFSRQAFGRLEWDVENPGIGSIGHWPPQGQASKRQLTVYTVRRLVDGFSSRDGRTSILLNYMNGQDYPLERLPKPVVDALEATEAGASRKNIVEMTRAQRQIIFDDAKQHALGVLYHLQNFVHEAAADKAHSFRKFQLSREFDTSDRLPPKPYLREGLRLRAMYMMREQDGRNRDGETKSKARPSFAVVRYPDGLFPWQFHYDFHRTGRTYLKQEGSKGPWIDYHKPNRHTQFISDRSTFPLRSLIPESIDGLLGAQGNVGVSSIVSAAIRLHDQRIHIGQAAGATAAICLRERIRPRDVPYSRKHLESVRHALCGEVADAAPLLLWGYRDLPADHAAFVAINRLAALGVLPIERRSVDFHANQPATREWSAQVVKLGRVSSRLFEGESMTRAEFCRRVWQEISGRGFSDFAFDRESPSDADADGIPDRKDALLFTRNKPIRFQIEKTELPPARDGIPPALPLPQSKGTRAFDFCGPQTKSAEGYDADRGGKYNATRGYGWLRDMSKNHRKRKALDGPRDSFIFTRGKDRWECKLPNGDYLVRLCVGDSAYEQKHQSVAVEGKRVVERRTTQDGEFAEIATEVTVQDGRLTVDIGSGLSGSNTCLNWLQVVPRPNRREAM